MGILKKAQADPTQDGEDIDVYEVALTSGTATLTWDEPFDEAPTVVVQTASGDAGWSDVTTTDIDVTGSGSETVHVIAVGPRS